MGVHACSGYKCIPTSTFNLVSSHLSAEKIIQNLSEESVL